MTMRRMMLAMYGPAALLGALAIVPAALARDADDAHGPDAMFKMMDANGDGKISAQEHADAAKKMFTKMDTNGDGKVTAAEMDVFHEHLVNKAMHGEASKEATRGANKETTKAGPGEMSSADKIKVVDANHDGVLTAEEHAAGSKSMFEKIDTDHDGYLTKAELEVGHARLMSKPAMGGGSK